MLKKWSNLQIDLEFLSFRIVNFFRKKGFVTKLHQFDNDRLEIIALQPHASGRIKVKVIKKDSNVTIDFRVEENKLIKSLGNLLTFFGLGFLFLANVQFLETAIRVETEFWPFLEEVIDTFRKNNVEV